MEAVLDENIYKYIEEKEMTLENITDYMESIGHNAPFANPYEDYDGIDELEQEEKEDLLC